MTKDESIMNLLNAALFSEPEEQKPFVLDDFIERMVMHLFGKLMTDTHRVHVVDGGARAYRFMPFSLFRKLNSPNCRGEVNLLIPWLIRYDPELPMYVKREVLAHELTHLLDADVKRSWLAMHQQEQGGDRYAVYRNSEHERFARKHSKDLNDFGTLSEWKTFFKTLEDDDYDDGE